MISRTTCSYCGVGCGIEVHTSRDPVTNTRVISRVRGDGSHPANFGRLCTKGATHAELMAATESRLDTAMVRPHRGAQPRSTAVDDAVTDAAARLRGIIDEHGPDAVALYVSGQMSLEAQYLATKLAKGFIRTVHMESNSRLCMASAGTGYKQSLGADGPPGSYDDFDHADLFFVSGSNMADCHPILFLRMADRLRAGAKLIVVDPRRTVTAERADLFLQIKSGTDVALLNGLLHLLIEFDAIDRQFIAEHTEGFDAMVDFLADYPPDAVAHVTGVAAEDIRTAARMIADAGEWMSCWTVGLNQSTHGTWNTNAICNLHLATGSICRPGSGPFSLTGQPNAMGGREMGYMGPGLPGQRSVHSAADRAFVERRWGLPPGRIRPDTGVGTVEMFERMAAGQIKACWIIATNPVATMANRRTTIAGLSAAELVITQDAYRDTATSRYADIALPAALWAEAESVTVNSERTLSLSRAALTPHGHARPDWQLVCQVATALGFGADFAYESGAQVLDEITQFSNPATGYDLRGVNHQRLQRGPVQWPCPPDGQDRHPIRYVNDGISQPRHVDAGGAAPRLAFPTASRRAVFWPRPHLDPAELPDDGYPLVLNTGRLPHQWHTMTKTGVVAKLNKLNGAPFVEVHPDDAAVLGIVDGTFTELASRRGRAVLPAVVTDRVRSGMCFVPFHWNDTHGADLAINALTSDAVDPDSLQPEFKSCAVALRALAAPGPATANPEPPAHVPAATVGDAPLIIWGSQTGTAEEFAGRVASQLLTAGRPAQLVNMADCRLADLAAAGEVLVVTSTFGDGGPPDDGADFWARLDASDAPALHGVRYAVLGIGDRAYDDFCGHARSIDARLTDLGASAMLGRAECEAYDDEPMTRWTDDVVRLLGPPIGAASARAVSLPKKRPAQLFSRNRPISAPLSRNVALTPAGADKEVRQVGFDISEHDVSYSVGDSLGVYATNSPANVNRWLRAAHLGGGETVVVDGTECSLRDALAAHYDICRVTPNLLDFIAASSPAAKDFTRLRANAAGFDKWLVGRDGIDVLNHFPVRGEPARWQEALMRLTPRSYSISSSPLVCPHEVQLTVAVVRYRGVGGGARGGVCSTYLADRASAPVRVFLQRSPHFHPPEQSDAPMIMIGPGTGVAPFRAFLQERRALGHTGRHWLFFGDRHAADNFYYRDELGDMHRDGFLTKFDLAFSRDQPQRVYVQHKMAQLGGELWRWLGDGAHLYVCGDATRMAKDVDSALTRIIKTHGRMSDEAAHDYKRELVATKRYLRDVY